LLTEDIFEPLDQFLFLAGQQHKGVYGEVPPVKVLFIEDISTFGRAAGDS
jgi:hypothetical protein